MFDFLIDDEPEPITPDEIFAGPNLSKPTTMSRKEFGKSVLRVYEKLNGDDWLFIQAQADPKAFMSLLSKMLPKQTALESVGDITVNLINRYGDQLEITQMSHAIKSPGVDGASPTGGNGSGQPDKTATSGNPKSAVGGRSPVLIERY